MTGVALGFITRLVLSIVILVRVHGETGTWTTSALALLMVSNEMTGWYIRRQANDARMIAQAISKSLRRQ